jgi:hypothetical protein
VGLERADEEGATVGAVHGTAREHMALDGREREAPRLRAREQRQNVQPGEQRERTEGHGREDALDLVSAAAAQQREHGNCEHNGRERSEMTPHGDNVAAKPSFLVTRR